MTLKQIAQRLDVDVKTLDLSFYGVCASCRKFGGAGDACPECRPTVRVEIVKEDVNDSR
jgi:hypothetical protein